MKQWELSPLHSLPPGLPHQLPIWDASSESGLRALGKGEFGYLGALAE